MNSMRRSSCNCGYNSYMPCNNDDVQNSSWDNGKTSIYQKACSNVANYASMHDDCSCGFDEENKFFPENPMYAQSYVPFQTMNKVFIPSVRIKNGNYFPGTC